MPRYDENYNEIIEETTSNTFTSTYNDTEGSVYDEDLIEDKDFVQASRIMYKMNNGQDFQGDDRELAEYGINFMGWFNYNIPKMTLDAARISNAEEEQQRAMLYMMDSYDDLGLSLAGTGRFIKGVALDPTTYLGLATFGIGTGISQAGKLASKATFKELLKQSTKGGMIASVESGIYTAVDDVNRQVVETSVSGEDIDLGRTAKMGAIGATIGFIGGTGITMASKKLTSKGLKEVAEKEADKLVNDKTDDVAQEVVTSNGIDKTTTAGQVDDSLSNLINEVRKVTSDGKPIAIKESLTKTIKTKKGKQSKELTIDAGFRQNLEELKRIIKPITNVMVETVGGVAKKRTPEDVASLISKQELNQPQADALHMSAAQAADEVGEAIHELKKVQSITKDAKVQQDIQQQVNDLVDNVLVPIHEIVDVFNTDVGRRMRGLQEFSIRSKDLLTNSEWQGLIQLHGSKEKAHDAYLKSVAKNKRLVGQKRKILELELKVKKDYQKGDIASSIQTKRLLEVEKDILLQSELEGEGLISGLYRQLNKPIKAINEVIISFVFSPATLVINTVPSFAKMIYKPFMNNLLRGDLNSSSFRTMTAEYSAMVSMIPTALKAAQAAWKYERSMLTGDSARFLENFNTIPRKYGGGVLRFFPRALLATDGFFENIHYRGYVVGNATAQALEEGAKSGKTGKALDDFVKLEVDKATTNAYKPQESVFDILYEQGISRGITDPAKLERFVKKEAAKSDSVFTEATDTVGRDYVQDVLFKRDFSGNGALSQLAKGYEGYINRHPVMRIAGQLFFRTPVRVFEEGFRLTAGLNLISPNFISDLKGKNGQMRQIKAQGEAMISYAIAGSVFAMYSTGNITGSKDSNYKLRRQGENAGTLEPYNMLFSDGSSFNYRNFDPFSTPVKIIVNALERAEVLAYRAEQGESIDSTAYDELQAFVSVAVGSIAQSIKDANLASGVNSIYKLVEDLQDPEGSEQIIKFIGQKVQTLYPNTLYKMSMQNDPVLSDPATLEQFIRYRINPTDELVPKRYSALGREIKVSNPRAMLYYFDLITKEERKRGLSKDELEVEQWLYRLGQTTNTHFTIPHKHKSYPFDLRTQTTKDGQETLYSRWVKYYRELNPVRGLKPLMSLPIGTPKNKGAAVKESKKIINEFRDLAFQRLMLEETGIQQRFQKDLFNKAMTETGSNDKSNLPFNVLRN